MADDKVLIEHKDLKETQEAPVRVSRRSYERLWKGRGWRLHSTKKKES
jgi:hypothetical protein